MEVKGETGDSLPRSLQHPEQRAAGGLQEHLGIGGGSVMAGARHMHVAPIYVLQEGVAPLPARGGSRREDVARLTAEIRGVRRDQP